MRRGGARDGIIGATTVTAWALACAAGAVQAGQRAHPAIAPRAVESRIIRFPGQHATVRLLRGVAAQGLHAQVVSFGAGGASRVTVVRGGPAAPPLLPRSMAGAQVERVTFADPHLPAVTVLRGPAGRGVASVDLFGPADRSQLDRIAFAVDGVESRHGADLGMWRPDPDGPQGPMQVSRAAATDVGGGDRFDLRQNRRLGRAYLVQMYSRYGNWADALAAYNWGPGNVDAWITGGRRPDKLPPMVSWYVSRVLRDALMPRLAAGL
jgi:Transglycosylase SLT domain